VRRRLLDAALEVVGERGFGQLSLEEVVERARTDSTTFHRQFESVEDCVTVAYAVVVEGLCEEILAAAISPRRSSRSTAPHCPSSRG
jgi:AcrR family transcriptional regulator